MAVDAQDDMCMENEESNSKTEATARRRSAGSAQSTQSNSAPATRATRATRFESTVSAEGTVRSDAVPAPATRVTPECDDSPTTKSSKTLGKARTMTETIQEAAKDVLQMWEKCQPYIKKAQPYMKKLEPVFESIYAICHVAFNLGMLLLPWITKHDEVVHVIFALILLFFGGQFAMCIACVQAFKQCGYSTMVDNLTLLRDEYLKAKEELNTDKEARAVFNIDKGGTVSFWNAASAMKETITAEKDEDRQLAFKRMYILMKCVDPNMVLDASKGLWVGIVAILSTLRSRMVYCVSIGANIGNNISKTFEYYIEGRLVGAFPGHKQWVTCALRIVCGVTGIIVSLVLTRVISAFCSALQGATILAKIIHKHLVAKPGEDSGKKDAVQQAASFLLKQPNLEEMVNSKQMNKFETIFMWVMALFGFAVQLLTGFNLPWYIKLPLFPLYAAENFLALFTVGPMTGIR